MSLPIQGKTIPQLDDTIISGLDYRTHVSVDGVSRKLRFRPKPEFMIFAQREEDLEASVLGANLEVPDGEKITVVIDKTGMTDFDLPKPFKIGLGSVLEIFGSTIEATINYTGTGAMFQRTNIGDDIRALLIHDIFITGDGTQKFCDLKGTSRLFVEVSRIQGFKGADTEFPFTKFDNAAAVNWIEGWRFRNPTSLIITNSNLRQATSPGVTFISVVTNVVCTVTINDNFPSTLQSIDSFVFFDPNAPAGSSFTVNGNKISAGNFYQKNTLQNVNFILAAAGGGIECAPDLPHTFLAGQFIVMSGYTNPSYNGTFLITTVFGVDSFVIKEIAFISNDSGTADVTSLDSTSVPVFAENNPMEPDSMFTGNAGLEISPEIEVVISTIGMPEVITDANWMANNLERFEDDTVTPNQGRLIAKDPSTRRYTVTYSATISKSTGPAANIGIVLLKDGNIVGVNPPRIFTTSTLPLTRTEIIEIAQDEVIQVAVINYDDTANIDVFQANLEVNRA